MAAKRATPQPVYVKTVCSVCGLDWDRHGTNPTKDECIELLKADLAKPRPVTVPSYPYWWWTTTPQRERPLTTTWEVPMKLPPGTICETKGPTMLEGPK